MNARTVPEPEPSDPVMDLAFAIDRAYVNQLRVLWASIFSHHRKGSLRLHVVHDGLADDQEAQLRSMAADHSAECRLHHIPGERIAGLMGNEVVASCATYFRLFLPEFLPEGTLRALYLDADMIVCRSLVPLFSTDLQGRIAGAIPDLDARDSCSRLDIAPDNGYFNSGVILLDPLAWSHHGIGTRALDYLRAHRLEPDKWKYLDQDALNVVLGGEWLALGAEWNVFACYRWFPPDELSEGQQRALRHPGIIHFTGPYKPWLPEQAPPYRNLYREYARSADVRIPVPLTPRAWWNRYRRERVLNRMRSVHRAAGLGGDF